MTEQRDLRASDSDRQAAAERLRAAHDEGRLDFAEYDHRLAQAYSSVTYADLDRLFADLPAEGGAEVAHVPPARPLAQRSRGRKVPAEPAVVAGMPTALKVIWAIWASVVAINITVWLLVSIGGSDTAYFWPMWLAIPGVVLVGATAAVNAVRTHRRAALER
jgi:hypothetical protein